MQSVVLTGHQRYVTDHNTLAMSWLSRQREQDGAGDGSAGGQAHFLKWRLDDRQPETTGCFSWDAGTVFSHVCGNRTICSQNKRRLLTRSRDVHGDRTSCRKTPKKQPQNTKKALAWISRRSVKTTTKETCWRQATERQATGCGMVVAQLDCRMITVFLPQLERRKKRGSKEISAGPEHTYQFFQTRSIPLSLTIRVGPHSLLIWLSF